MVRKGQGKDAWSLSLPKRVTKQNYDENEYYRNALHKEGKGAPRPPRPLQVADFQFFDVTRLEELREIEMRNYEYRKVRHEGTRGKVAADTHTSSLALARAHCSHPTTASSPLVISNHQSHMLS